MHHLARLSSPSFLALLPLILLNLGAAEPPRRISGQVPGAGIELCVQKDPDDFTLARQLLKIEEPVCELTVARDSTGRFAFLLAAEARKMKLHARFPGQLSFSTWYLNENLRLPDLAPPAPNIFVVQVADEAGRPVAGARVYIDSAASPLPRPWRVDPRQSTTDADGRASLPFLRGERFAISVVAPAHHPWSSSEKVTPAGQPFRVGLSPRPARRVQTLSKPGQPLEGATVSWQGLPLGLTDARGRLDVFVDDSDALTFASPRHRRWFFLSPPWQDGVLTTYDGGGAMLFGKVRDPLGRAPAGARIQLRQTGGLAEETWSTVDGRFSFGPLRQGSYRLRASAPGFGDAVGLVHFDEGGYIAQRDHSLDLELQGGETKLGGRVSDLDGAPIEGAEVRVLRPVPYAPKLDPAAPAIGSADARSDRGGSYLVGGVLPGEEVALEFRAAGKVTRIVSPITADGSLTVDVGLAAEAVLELAVTGAAGAPVADARIVVAAKGAEGPGEERQAVSDAGGLARLAALPVGVYRVTVSAQDYILEETTLALGAGPRRLQLELERGAALEGHFVDADGKPVERAIVSVRDPRQPERILAADTTNSAGYFRFSGIAPGTWNLHAAAPSWPPLTGSLEADGDEVYRRDFQLPPGETLRGVVLTADREPAAGVEVSLVDPDQQTSSDLVVILASVTTDGSGTFAFEKLGRHRLRLSASLPHHYTARRDVEVGKDLFVEIVLEPPPR
jgi:protocatechuate 3,4-dioxygenase beta subunit